MADRPESLPRELDADVALRNILEGTAAETGERFFAALVRHLCNALGTHSAWVTEWLPNQQRLRSLAFWSGNDWVADYEYDIRGTPCEPVVEEDRLVHIRDDVMSLFPDDPDLPAMGAVSYMGVPLTDVDGRIMGHLAVQDTRPMPEDPRLTAVFHIFAERAAAELRRLRAECEVREREAKLARLIDSAMDAIIELDHDLHITRLNTAAEDIFECSVSDVTGRDFGVLLDAEARTRLGELCETLDNRPAIKRYLWIPGGLTGRRANGEQFPAEATLSRYELGGQTFFTLILRNVNARVEAERKISTLTAETEYLRDELSQLQGSYDIIGQSAALQNVLRDAHRVAATDSTVLILGETGTGKELIARAIHSASERSKRPFITVNCAAIPEGLIESELFGHEKGAFTGATQKRDGRFTLADRGTIFLDEIGELPKDLQSKLLRVLQEGEFEPVGSSTTHNVNVRVLAATNRNLEDQVSEGAFREDLYYRLNVFPITVPPLRDRREDIPLLAEWFGKRIAQRMHRRVEPLTPVCIRRLQAYAWPGNIRELENVIERAVITSRSGRLDVSAAIPASRQTVSADDHTMRTRTEDVERICTVAELRQLERENMLRALESTGWRVSGEKGAAALLGMQPSTLTSRMKALGVKRPK
jgi:PAS domain S-box-containing protein